MRRRIFLLGLPGLAGCSAGRKPRLNVLNYTDYIGKTTIADFEREFGAEVRYSPVIEGSEETMAKTISGNSGWDVVFPENRLVNPMREMGLLRRLDPARLPNLKHLAARFQSPEWDRNLDWSIPYLWSCCGILSQAGMNLTGWSDLWEPRYRGKITMLDEPSEVFGACLKRLGYSINTNSPEELRQAQQLAGEQKKILRAYLNTEVRDQVAAGDVQACQLWAGSAQLTMDGAPQLQFCHPREGFSLYCDCVAILAESQRAELAHEFVNYLCRPEVAAAITQASRASTPNAAAIDHLPASFRALKTLFPGDEVLARGEWFRTSNAPTQRLRDRLWTEVKSM
ncbi:ABC transporter substrate-binding protein [Bryobacter aggregatus]|uniref:ABC transporter substrate-binding protein n=1 Tax=Bryobacter aggregatus TaxID=360054 RepID=UPI0004E1ADBC|nr:spermidine/putrescine ABC transporter substrate-binding protein [Bryobacter aggregatus]